MYLIITIPEPPFPAVDPGASLGFCPADPPPPPVFVVPGVAPDASPPPFEPLPPPPVPPVPPVPEDLFPPPPPPAKLVAGLPFTPGLLGPIICVAAPAPPLPPFPDGALAPTAVAPPPPPAWFDGLFKLFPPLLPCGGLTGGVLPEPPEVTSGELEPPEPPEPPSPPVLADDGLTAPPPPPPVDVIVEKLESDPFLVLAAGLEPVQFPGPPLPTTIGYDCAVTVKPESVAASGLAV